MRLIITIAYFLISLSVLSQDSAKYKWFTGLNAGYGIGVLRTAIDEDVKASAVAPSSKAYHKDRFASIGTGLRIQCLLGYQIDTASFLELNFSYNKSDKLTFTNQIFQYSVDNSPYYITTKILFVNNIYASFLYGFIYPITFKWNGIVKTGATIGKSYISGISSTKTYGYSPIPPPGSQIQYEYKYNSSVSLGFMADVGARYSLSKKTRLTCDLFFQLQSIRLLNRETVAYTVDDQDRLQGLSDSEKKIEYYNGKPNDKVTGKNQPLVVPMSNIGILLGFNYLF